MALIVLLGLQAQDPRRVELHALSQQHDRAVAHRAPHSRVESDVASTAVGASSGRTAPQMTHVNHSPARSSRSPRRIGRQQCSLHFGAGVGPGSTMTGGPPSSVPKKIGPALLAFFAAFTTAPAAAFATSS